MHTWHPDSFFDLSRYKHHALFQNVSSIWEVLPKISPYLKSRSLGQIQTEIPSGAYIINAETIAIGKGTLIEPGAYIKGPCTIGENCVIRHGAYIRGDFICGDHCIIGHDTEVKNSLFLDQVHAAHFAYVGDSILGNRVNLGAGVKCANLKFDQTPIVVHFEGESFPTNLRKCGAFIGDNSQIGCNAVTNPGVVLGKNVFCYPCINLSGVIPSNAIVKDNTQQKIILKATKT